MHIFERILSRSKANRDRNIKKLIPVFLLAAGILLLSADYVRSITAIDGTVERNSYGEGSRTEELEVAIGDRKKKIPIEVEVSEQNYSSEEVRELFDSIIRQMEPLILGENESLDRVETDLNLVTEIPEEPIEVAWELDRYDVMNIRGEIQIDELEKLSEEGVLVTLNAVLTYTENEEAQALYQCVAKVCPQKKSEEEEKVRMIEDEIQVREKEDRTQETWELPEEVQGQELSYYRKMDTRGLVLIVMAFLVGILLYALKIQNQEKAKLQRSQEMILDYPEILNKMTLFLGAGMTVRRAWNKIVEDYECQKKVWGTRYAYEEMRQACHEMDSGISEAESYENFGKRCNLQVYIRFGALLSQNLRKGTKDLTQMLKIEEMQAFEERKAQAKRLGEEAETKLLFPMFLMLAIVLIIVIVPAFMSMQM